MYKKIGICLILIALSALSIFGYYYFGDMDFSIKSYKESITLDVNGNYIEEIPVVCYGSLYKCNILSPQKIGSVDITRIGEYSLVYQYEYKNNQLVLSQKIEVVDRVNPVITVSGKTKICPNGNALEQKYQASDNYDGNLTDKVIYKNENNQYYFEVTDSSGNMAKVEADISFDDLTKPTITLKGNKTVSLYVSEKYQEPGYQASDDCDGDLTKKVVVKDNINNQKAGTYKVTYSVKDSSNNEYSITRNVIINEKEEEEVVTPPVTNPPSNKTIYLTFDDGPCSHTGRLLDVLDKYNVKATFFVTNQSSRYQNYIGLAYSRGHSIGIHTYSHDFSIYRSVDAYFNDFYKMNDIIKQQTGIETKIVRFPGGSSNTVSKKYKIGIMTTLARELENRGYVYFDWNLDSGDTGGTTTSKGIYNNVVNKLNNQTKMILMHDIKSYTVDAIEDIIQYGLSNGYTFAPIDVNTPTFHHGIRN